VVTAAVLTAGAVEVKQQTEHPGANAPAAISRTVEQSPPIAVAPAHNVVAPAPAPAEALEVEPAPVATEPAPIAADTPEELVVEAPAEETEGATGGSEAPEATEQEAAGIDGAAPSTGVAGAPAGAGTGTVVVTVGGGSAGTTPATATPPAETAPPPPPPAENPAPVEETPPASPGGSEAPAAEG
jgi:hypothetical protein